MSIKMIKCGFCCEQFEYEKLISNYQYGGESHICINCNDYISKRRSLAEFIPIELVNHILSFRPRHPDAELIKELKEKTVVRYMAINPMMRKSLTPYSMTFKQLDYNPIHFEIPKSIFSKCIRPNSIYKIKTKKYKNSEGFYWGKYYTEKKAYEELEEAKKSFCYCGDIYSIELVNIDNDSLDEHIVESMVIDGRAGTGKTYVEDESGTESEDEYESDDDEEYEEDEEDEIDYIEPELVEAKANLKKFKDY